MTWGTVRMDGRTARKGGLLSCSTTVPFFPADLEADGRRGGQPHPSRIKQRRQPTEQLVLGLIH